VKPRGPGARAELPVARRPTESLMFGETLREEGCERGTLLAALKQGRANQGRPGSEGRSVNELPAFLKPHWPAIKEQLLGGTYQPQMIRRREIPKPGGQGSRKGGIPCVVDRVLQQALLQVLQRQGDSTFSDSS
jgi:RNA-directed DNA polymerase